jgi:hypothetical protein
MSDAWDTLVAGSTIDEGDAWAHLVAQGGGSGEETVLVEAIRDADIVSVASASIATETLTADIIAVASATVTDITCTADSADQYEATI